MGKSVSLRQIAAITLAGRIGKRLQKDRPELAELYRSGKTQPEIVEILNIKEEYEIKSSRIAISAVCFALIGFMGNPRCKAYSGLMDENELETLCREHRNANGEKMRDEKVGFFSLSEDEQRRNKQKAGRTAKSQRKGIFALTSEEIGKNTRKAYEEGRNWWARLSLEQRREHGKRLHKRGVGIHKLTSAEKREAAFKGLETLGITPWSQEEDSYLLDVLKSSDYVLTAGAVKKRDYSRINEEVNKRFHNGHPTRTKNAIKQRLIMLMDSVPSDELVVLGSVHWSQEEEKYLADALKSGEYTYEYKPGRISFDYEKLRNDLNSRYHRGDEVRTKKGVRTRILKLKSNPRNL